MTTVEQSVVGGSFVGRGVRALSLAAIPMFLACGGDEAPHDELHVDRGDISVSWQAAPDAASQQIAGAMQQGRLFEEIASSLNEGFKFPRDLPVKHMACGEENAFYDPNTQSLQMCYELLEKVAQVAVQTDPNASDEETGNRVVGTWMFVFFHELGHGLVDMYDLPITGREEDSVDDFSTVLLVEAGLGDYALNAAEYWSATSSDEFSQLEFADEHSLNQQRFFEILCLVYGSAPTKYQHLVDDGFLPDSRAQSCPIEYQKKRDAWEQLLEPWTK